VRASAADAASADAHGLIIGDPAEAAAVLCRGGLLGLPTETVYGLAADARNPQAVARVFAVKGRPADHPLIVHVLGVADLAVWGRDLPAYARALAEAFWPGPLTLIVPRSPLAGDHVTGGQDTVGLRAPSHPVARAVLEHLVTRATAGIAAPSANRFGRVSPTTAAHVVSELGDRLLPGVDAVLDGGACTVGVESTILDCTRSAPILLRPGAITTQDIAAVLGAPPPDRMLPDRTSGRDGAAAEVRAPGTLAAHYAPNAAVHVVAPEGVKAMVDRLGTALAPVGLLALASAPTPDGAVRLAAPVDSARYAAQLYAALQEADALHLRHVIAVPPQDDGVGAAIRDRLGRAAVGSGGTDGDSSP
jgi:L-threonylcarbamoyladenylate synthase